MDDIKLLGIFKERNFGLTGIISVLILTLIIGLLAFKTRNDQWNVWKLNKDITFIIIALFYPQRTALIFLVKQSI